jgi:trimeric autotransporter adhesin
LKDRVITKLSATSHIRGVQYPAYMNITSGLAAALLLILAGSIPTWPQSTASRLVTRPIDQAQRVTLLGSVHSLVRTGKDLGPVADALPAQRILLLLNRPPEREAALEQFLRDIHNRDSASYHQWITPEQFGQRFGPADADIQTAVSWLQSKGFTVARVAKSKLFIDFTGTVGQLRNALDADIHQYNVQGEVDYANAHDLTVPAAVGALVRGVSPLSNLRAKPYVKVAGQALYSTTSKRATPPWTLPNPFGTPNPYGFALAPEDLATQYDLTPLYQAGTDGSGQTIGIINESNIDEPGECIPTAVRPAEQSYAGRYRRRRSRYA